MYTLLPTLIQATKNKYYYSQVMIGMKTNFLILILTKSPSFPASYLWVEGSSKNKTFWNVAVDDFEHMRR